MHRLHCQYQLQFHVVQNTYSTAWENLMPLSLSQVKHNVLAERNGFQSALSDGK